MLSYMLGVWKKIAIPINVWLSLNTQNFSLGRVYFPYQPLYLSMGPNIRVEIVFHEHVLKKMSLRISKAKHFFLNYSSF